MRLKNNTDEDIVIPAGEMLRLRGDKETSRTMSRRVEVLVVKEVGEEALI